MIEPGALRLGRRLADLRRRRDEVAEGRATTGPSTIGTTIGGQVGSVRSGLALRGEELARRLADAVDGEWIHGSNGGYVRVDAASSLLPIDRERLGRLPDGAPPGVPLICLDTETTGLATGTGTVAFLIGLGTWSGDRFHQVQLLLPDHAEEPALLDALAATIPPEAWLVTYNGRASTGRCSSPAIG